MAITPSTIPPDHPGTQGSAPQRSDPEPTSRRRCSLPAAGWYRRTRNLPATPPRACCERWTSYGTKRHSASPNRNLRKVSPRHWNWGPWNEKKLKNAWKIAQCIPILGAFEKSNAEKTSVSSQLLYGIFSSPTAPSTDVRDTGCWIGSTWRGSPPETIIASGRIKVLPCEAKSLLKDVQTSRIISLIHWWSSKKRRVCANETEKVHSSILCLNHHAPHSSPQ